LDIAGWLRGLSLERYAETFRDNAIELEVLPELSEADLEKPGVLRVRAATDFARLWGEQDRRPAARDLLAAVYGWFTVGCNTAHLKDAKALLDQLA
jgi:predicted ATPase